MRNLIYYIATTLDGFIAHEDGSVDGFSFDESYLADLLATFPETFPSHFPGHPDPRPANRWFDTVLMGRATYEVGVKEGITNPYTTLQQYVFSRSMPASPDPNIILVSGDAVETVKALKQETGKAIWLCGGAALATSLLNADLIDGLIVKVNPVIFGSGIPLFEESKRPVALELVDHKIYASGHAVLHYRVKR